jgi:hypothetical protein
MLQKVAETPVRFAGQKLAMVTFLDFRLEVQQT